MRRLAALLIATSALGLAACGSTDLVNDELDAQRDNVEDVIRNPEKAADEAIQEELRRRGVDGSTP